MYKAYKVTIVCINHEWMSENSACVFHDEQGLLVLKLKLKFSCIAGSLEAKNIGLFCHILGRTKSDEISRLLLLVA